MTHWIIAAIPCLLLAAVGVWCLVVVWPHRQWHRYGDTPPKDRPR